MSLSLMAGLAWLVVANVAGMIPSRDNHWNRAYALIALGVPLLVWVFFDHGVWVGLLFLAAGMSVLRWPVRYLLRWIKARF